MPQVADITDSEQWIVRTALRERYGREVPLQIADSDIRLRPSDRELTSCPVFYWEDGDCHFVVFKSGDRKYRCQFYYRLYQQMGTGIPEYDDLTECVVSLLQVQADQVAKERGDIE
jgi:hypothetical protein